MMNFSFAGTLCKSSDIPQLRFCHGTQLHTDSDYPFRSRRYSICRVDDFWGARKIELVGPLMTRICPTVFSARGVASSTTVCMTTTTYYLHKAVNVDLKFVHVMTGEALPA